MTPEEFGQSQQQVLEFLRQVWCFPALVVALLAVGGGYILVMVLVAYFGEDGE